MATKKTTLNIDETVMRRLKEEAARQGKTMSHLAELALRRLLDQPPTTRELPPLPSFSLGEPLVDISDREALYRVLNAERWKRLYGIDLGED